MRKALMIVLLASAVSVAGCKRSATGQVVAVVNGEEVSQSELNGELQRAGNTGGANKQMVQTAALQSLIDRKLLVQQAKDRGIDKDPEFLQAQRRMNDELMISMLGKQVTKNVPVPSAAEVQSYIASHPEMFAGRTVYALDQIVFPAPQDLAQLKSLEKDHTLEEVANSLTQMNIKFARRKGTLDTAAAPAGLVKQINALPSGEPFVLGAQGNVIVSVVADKRVQPLDAEASNQLATQAIRRDAVQNIAQKQLKQARDSAKIDYQQGYAPPAGAKKAS